MRRAFNAFVVLFVALALFAGCQSFPGLSAGTHVDDAAITASVKTKLVADNDAAQRALAFDPLHLVDGIEASADPLPVAAWGDRGDAKPDRTPVLNSSSFFFSWLLEEPRSTSSNWTPMALSSESSLVPFLE